MACDPVEQRATGQTKAGGQFDDPKTAIGFVMPRPLNPVPANLEAVVIKCLKANLDKRYPFMSLLVRDLKAALYV